MQDYLRGKPGQPVLYLHNRTPVLEQPSEISRKTVEFKMNESFTFGKVDEKKLNSLKRSEGLPVPEPEEAKKKTKKKKKQPNPLSCKKKKKKSDVSSKQNGRVKAGDGIQSKQIEKRKRTRLHVPAHVRAEILKK